MPPNDGTECVSHPAFTDHVVRVYTQSLAEDNIDCDKDGEEGKLNP